MSTPTCPVCAGPTREVDPQHGIYACDTPGTPCYQIRFTSTRNAPSHILPEDFHRFVKACQGS
jgi:hypothetical protein